MQTIEHTALIQKFTHLSVLGTAPREECTIMRHARSMVAPAAGHPPHSLIVPTTGQFPRRRSIDNIQAGTNSVE
jgi:hypothetical protein